MTASFSSLNLVLLGPPGSGATTQARVLAERYRISHIAAGQALEEEIRRSTGLGQRVGLLVSNGQPVPTKLLSGIVLRHLHSLNCARGFLLDGYPRSVEEAVLLDGVLAELGRTIERVLLFDVPDEVALSRVRGTAAEETLRGRLETFRLQIAPLADFYRRRGLLVEVDASPSIAEVSETVMQAVGAPVGA